MPGVGCCGEQYLPQKNTYIKICSPENNHGLVLRVLGLFRQKLSEL